jgi:opacity protein-like surface antigen
MLQADAYDPFGTDKKVSTSKYYDTKSFSPNFFAGFDNSKNFKIELGYKQNSTTQSANDPLTISNIKGTATTKHKLETSALSLDFRPYATISDNFLVYGIAGLTYYKLKVNESARWSGGSISESVDETSVTKNKLAPTLGFGAEFKLTKNIFTRAQAKYSHINETFKYEGGSKALKIKGATDLALGVGLYF